MPLSEEELRLLEQMERALVEEDPKFASTLRGTAMRTSARRRGIIAAFVFALGISLLFVGVLTEWYVGIIGFVLMLGSATLALSTARTRQAAASDPRNGGGTSHPSGFTSYDGGRRPRRGRGRSSGGARAPFMERMESRWRKRRENGGL
ncbi:MAG: rane protein [Nocardioides sp.]|nr:rane protein [Nocardioides sp.]